MINQLGGIFSIICLAGVVYLVLLPGTQYPDYFWFYTQLVGILNGCGPYDVGAQAELMQRLYHLPAGALENQPIGYPPWYYAMSLFLGYFERFTSARIWFSCSVALIAGSVFLILDGKSFRYLALGAVAAFLFSPTIGVLVVGQPVVPLLFGVALLDYGLCRKLPNYAAFGMLLLSCKPHLGGPIILTALVWILRNYSPEIRRRFMVQASLIAGVAIGASFLIEPAWLTTYPEALFKFAGLKDCDTCGSLVSALSTFFEWNMKAWWIFGLLLQLIGIVAILTLTGRGCFNVHPSSMCSLAVLLSLLTPAYVRNYDYILLLYPIFSVLRDFKRSRVTQLLMVGSYLWITIGVQLGTREEQGNIILIGALLALIGWIQSYWQCDGSGSAEAQ